MKNKKWIYLVIAVCVIVCAAFVILRPKDKDEKVIKGFLKTAFTKSEESVRLNELIMESRTFVGSGVGEEETEASLEKGKKADEEFEKVYGTYLDEHGVKQFEERMYTYIVSLHSECETCEVLDTNVEKTDNYYKYEVTLDVDGSEQKLEGRADMTDGKINNIVLVYP